MNKSDATMPDFDFLVWVRNTFFFRQDAYNLMLKLGFDEGLAFIMVRSDGFMALDIINMYQEFGVYTREWNALMTHLLNDYNRISKELAKTGLNP